MKITNSIEIPEFGRVDNMTKEIANKEHISAHTVMTHRKNIFRKLEVNSIPELTKFAIRNGLIDIID